MGAGNIFHPLTPVMQLGHVELHAGAKPSKTHLKFHPFFGFHEEKKKRNRLVESYVVFQPGYQSKLWGTAGDTAEHFHLTIDIEFKMLLP